MKVLLVAATEIEVKPILTKMASSSPMNGETRHYAVGGNKIDVLITGIGILDTAFHLSTQLHKETYDLVINAGIAGSFDPDLSIGAVLHVTEEVLRDTGIEEDGKYFTLFEKDLVDKDRFPYRDGVLVNPSKPQQKTVNSLPTVRGLTTSMLYTDPDMIQKTRTKYLAEVESMEGAALFYVCLMEKVPFIEIRSISNQVGERDREKWDVVGAVEKLNEKLLEIFEELK